VDSLKRKASSPGPNNNAVVRHGAKLKNLVILNKQAKGELSPRASIRLFMGSLFIAILVILVLVSLYYKSSDGDDREQKEKETIHVLKERYQKALRTGDKATARKYGRDYYAYLRGSRTLPLIDEQAIENDIEAIK
jgi:hypothetical protein